MEKVIIDNFEIRGAATCFGGLVRDVMKYHGLEIHEDLLLGLASGWLFRFGYGVDNDYGQQVCKETDMIVIEDGIYEFDLLHQVTEEVFGFRIEEIDCEDVEMIWSILRETIDQGNIPLVAVNTENLEYFPPMIRSQRGHFVAVYGYDLAEEKVYIGDVLIPTVPRTTFQGSISLENFLEGITLRLKYNKIKIGIWVLHQTKPFTGISNQVYQQSLQRVIEKNQEANFNYFDRGMIYSGIHAIERFASEIGTWQDYFDEAGLKDHLEFVYGGITNRGGPAVSRLQYVAYLEELQEVLDVDLTTLIEKVQLIAKDWSIVGNLMIRYSVANDERSLNKIQTRLKNLLLAEQEALDLLQTLLGKF